jgi:hypothetical protein
MWWLLGGLVLWLVLASVGALALGAVIGLADRCDVRSRHDMVAAQEVWAARVTPAGAGRQAVPPRTDEARAVVLRLQRPSL